MITQTSVGTHRVHIRIGLRACFVAYDARVRFPSRCRSARRHAPRPRDRRLCATLPVPIRLRVGVIVRGCWRSATAHDSGASVQFFGPDPVATSADSASRRPLTGFDGEIELAPVRQLECPAYRRRIREQRTVRQRAQNRAGVRFVRDDTRDAPNSHEARRSISWWMCPGF
jgi:hypothetical protein